MSRKLFAGAVLLLALLIAAVCMLQFLQDDLYHRMMNDPQLQSQWNRYETLMTTRTKLAAWGPGGMRIAVLLGLTAALQDHGMLRRGRNSLLALAGLHLGGIALLYALSGGRADLAELLIFFIDCWSAGMAIGLPLWAVGRLTRNL